MGISINAGFDLGSAQALDSRMYLTAAQMTHGDPAYINEAVYPDYALVIGKEDGKVYLFNKGGVAGAKFTEFSGGGTAPAAGITKEISASDTVGGIEAGASYSIGTAVEDILIALLNPYKLPTVSAVSASPNEAYTGEQLSNVAVSFSVTKGTSNIQTVTLTAGADTKTWTAGADPELTADSTSAQSLTYTIAGPMTTDTAVSVVVTCVDTKTATASANLKFYGARYTGTSDTDTVADVTALTKAMHKQNTFDVAYTAADDRLVLALPAGMSITKVVDQNGFDNTSAWVAGTLTTGTEALFVTDTPVTCTNFTYTFTVE